MRKCIKCLKPRKTDFFHKGRTECKLCIRQRNSRYYRRNKQSITARVSAWRLSNPEKVRQYKRKTKYGLEQGHYELLLFRQGGCGICRLYPDGIDRHGKYLCVDHDHVTGVIRGLLCTRCNTGRFYNNVELMRQAIKYHRRPPGPRILKV